MKIGFLIEYFYPFKGGAENNCFYLAREIAKNNDVHVFTSNIYNLKNYEIIDNIHIHRYKNLFRYKYYLSFTPGLFDFLRYDLDILHVHSFGFLWHDFLIILSKIFKKTKIINTPHGPFMALGNYRWYEKLFKNITEFFEYFTNRLYDSVIEVNPSQDKWMITKGINKSKMVYLPNGIPKDFLKRVEINKFIKKYNLRNKFVISYVGRIQKYKGLDQVLEILPNLLKVKKNIIFVILGRDADDKERLKILIKELKLENNVLFLNVGDKEKECLYQVSEIFILPSEWEAFGIVILESMAKGTAVISTRTEGGLFLIKEKINGCLFDYGNLEELENKFKTLFNNKLRTRIKKNNLIKAKNFTWEKIGKNLEKIYKQI